MSAPLFKDDILFLQRMLRAEGLLTTRISGRWDAATEAAIGAFDEASRAIEEQIGKFDARSEAAIQALSLRAQREARLCLRKLTDRNIRVRIISGTRSYEQQNKLFRQGRYGNPGPIVTNARGGESNHNFGMAWDIGLFSEEGRYLTDAKSYTEAAAIATGDALEWGGAWKKFIDRPHYQLRMNISMADLRDRFESTRSQPLFA